MKTKVLFILLTLIVSCSSRNDKLIDTTVKMNQNKKGTDSLDIYFLRTLDSFRFDKQYGEMAEVCRLHLVHTFSPFNQNVLNKRFFEANFSLIKYNSYRILMVNRGPWSHLEPHLLLYFIDENDSLIHKDSISGCHYYNGELDVVDWNKDGDDELVFNLHYPTTSVYRFDEILDVYEFDLSTGFRSIFSLVEKTRDCSIPTSEEHGTEIVRTYEWTDPKSIRITETIYQFDCESSVADEQVNYERIRSSKSYSALWSDSEGKFIDM